MYPITLYCQLFYTRTTPPHLSKGTDSNNEGKLLIFFIDINHIIHIIVLILHRHHVYITTNRSVILPLTTPFTSNTDVVEAMCFLAASEQAGYLYLRVFSCSVMWYFMYLSILVACRREFRLTRPILSMYSGLPYRSTP